MAAGAPAAAAALDADAVYELRLVRLYHWRLVLEGAERMQDRRCSRHSREAWRIQHDQHTLYVRALNRLFAVDDTAERDRDHMDRHGCFSCELAAEADDA